VREFLEQRKKQNSICAKAMSQRRRAHVADTDALIIVS
jgi:hypothetical protein